MRYRVGVGSGESEDEIREITTGKVVANTRHPASEKFHALLKEMGDLHDKKQADYGREDDPFSNVRATEEWGQAAWVGALIRGTDKLRRLQKVARGGQLNNESARDSFLDLAVYALIGLVLYDEQYAPSTPLPTQPKVVVGIPGLDPGPVVEIPHGTVFSVPPVAVAVAPSVRQR